MTTLLVAIFLIGGVPHSIPLKAYDGIFAEHICAAQRDNTIEKLRKGGVSTYQGHPVMIDCITRNNA